MHHLRINIICILIDIVIGICIKDAPKYASFRDIYIICLITIIILITIITIMNK